MPPHLQMRMAGTIVMGGDSTRSPGTSAIAAVSALFVGVSFGSLTPATRSTVHRVVLGAQGGDFARQGGDFARQGGDLSGQVGGFAGQG
eukprot:7535353-Pyramimonas_sp.AAC.1